MTKKEIAYENIRNDIFCQKLPPRAKLVISDLAKRYNMSTIPIREALTMLENDHLVTNIPYTGFIVALVDFDDYIEYSLMRNQLECLAVRIALTYLTSESLMAIRLYQEELRKQYKEGRAEEYVITNREFYRSLYSFAPCEEIKYMINSLDRKCYHSPSILLLIPSRIEASLEEHEALIEAISINDAESAAQIMFVHRLNSLLTLIRELKYNLMKPNYKEQHILRSFFTDDALEDRNLLIGKIDRWASILESVSVGFSSSQIVPVNMTTRYIPTAAPTAIYMPNPNLPK